MTSKKHVLSFLILLTMTMFYDTSFSTENLSKNRPLFYAWVMLGDNGQPIVRVLTQEAACPALTIDGKTIALTLRSGPEIMEQSLPPARFPERVCETKLAKETKSVVLNGKKLPLPVNKPQRIVVLGDTGCRLKQSHFQLCNNPQDFPYKEIAQQAALWKPDLVVHLGDYHYRETPCPENIMGCKDSPWGYGYDTWEADFFYPSSTLLEAAPWVFVRGNHETCERAGQGWWRYLSPASFSKERTCANRLPGITPDIEDAYPIPLGEDAQFIVWDSSYESNAILLPDDPRFARYKTIYGQLADLVQRTSHSIALSHHPLLGIRPQSSPGPVSGAVGIQSVFKTLNPYFLPPGIDMLMGGHIHLWEQISFRGNSLPSQFIIGNSGTKLETGVFPNPLPEHMIPYEGAKMENFSTLEQEHGFTILERLGQKKWRVQEVNVHGTIRRTCLIEGKSSSCR